MISLFECMFSREGAENRLGGRCPNWRSELVRRPIRPVDRLARHPASIQRVVKPNGGRHVA
jgi:hypothetical protein